MPLLDAYLVQGHRHDLMRATAGTRRFERPARRLRGRRTAIARTH